MTAPRTRALRVGPRSAVALTLASLSALAMFLWPLYLPAPPSAYQHQTDAPFVFVVILPVLVLVVLAQLSDGGMDAKALAMLGVLSAVNAALRPLGAGTSGVETVFFLLILAGRVFGPGFGFVLGCTSLAASALLTAGVGPWLPFQMMTSAWVGMFAGLLPDRWRGRPIRGWREIALLCGFGVVSALLFGALMNLWFWPFLTGATAGDPGPFSYLPGDGVGANLERFLRFTLLTSTLTWDMGRAITNVVAICVLGPPLLAVLRRAVRRAVFEPRVTFLPADPERPASGHGLVV